MVDRWLSGWQAGGIALLLVYVAIAIGCMWWTAHRKAIEARWEQFQHWRACRADRRFRERMRRYWERHPIGKWDRTCDTDAPEEHETFGSSRYA